MCMECKRSDGEVSQFGGSFNVDDWFEADKSVNPDDRYYENRIDDLDFDMGKNTRIMRDILKSLVKVTVTVGKGVIRVGKIILDILIKIVSNFPNTIMGIVFGYFFGYICSLIPFIGWAIGPAITPLFVLAGGLAGFYADFTNQIAKAGMESTMKKTIHEELANLGLGTA